MIFSKLCMSCFNEHPLKKMLLEKLQQFVARITATSYPGFYLRFRCRPDRTLGTRLVLLYPGLATGEGKKAKETCNTWHTIHNELSKLESAIVKEHRRASLFCIKHTEMTSLTVFSIIVFCKHVIGYWFL